MRESNYFKIFILFLCLSFSFNGFAQSLYKTPSGKKYHLETCRMVENVSKKIDAEDISKYNLTACKICKPQILTYTTNNYINKNKAVGTSISVQCKGKTKKGLRCKHKTKLANGYCYQHKKQNSTVKSYSPSTTSSTCGARTKSGTPCKRKVKNGGRCYQH